MDLPASDPPSAPGGLEASPATTAAVRPASIRRRLHDLPERTMRSVLLALSRRRSLGRLARWMPLSRTMVARFVSGETLDEALPALERIRDAGLRTPVDVLGESVSSSAAASAAADRYLALLDALAARGLDGNVSLKLTQMGLDIGHDVCRANVERVFRKAGETRSFVRIDMEDHTKTDATLGIWSELRPILPSSGVVIQAALMRSDADVDALIAERGRVRLCKGAYKEPASVAYQDKADVDRAYVRLMERLLREGEYPALATHDERIVRRAIAFVQREGIGPERFEFQMLYGIRRDLQESLVRDGWTVRVYVPFGSEWYPYFMRRLAERPANVAFLLRSVLRERRGGSASLG
ncbi:MAG TPA: proline dehydrogenase family protein [Candidatus Dormibacteraeota bacterium]|nr:proline dehydrogenase family protein [Candidatus Dormibacteraeota bacterium]